MGLILCVVCTVQAKDRVIERPPFLAWSSSNIEVDKIVMSDTVTTVYIKAFYRPKYWIKIASGSAGPRKRAARSVLRRPAPFRFLRPVRPGPDRRRRSFRPLHTAPQAGPRR